jgi:hypothetical protein
MSDNPCIAAVARILGSNEPPSALATILFDHYSALSSDNERSAFTIALIGELMICRARQSMPEAAGLGLSEGHGAPEIEITEDMAAVGAAIILTEVSPDVVLFSGPDLAAKVYRAMDLARRRTTDRY